VEGGLGWASRTHGAFPGARLGGRRSQTKGEVMGRRYGRRRRGMVVRRGGGGRRGGGYGAIALILVIIVIGFLIWYFAIR